MFTNIAKNYLLLLQQIANLLKKIGVVGTLGNTQFITLYTVHRAHEIHIRNAIPFSIKVLYLFEYKSLVCISHTSIFDIQNSIKIF